VTCRTSRQSAHEDGKVVSSTLRPLFPPGDIPGTIFVRGCIDPRDTVEIKRRKSPNNAIWNRTRDLPPRSPVAQRTAPSRVPPLSRILQMSTKNPEIKTNGASVQLFGCSTIQIRSIISKVSGTTSEPACWFAR
jgi:hypothetical protein